MYFFAENGHVTLEEYAVTNDYRTNEVFFYQFDIETGDNFTVPTGKQAEIKSFSSITLEPGFEAEAGSNVQIEIVNDALFDTDCNCTATNQLPSGAKIADGTDDIGENVYENIRTSVTELKLYPNPASDFVVIEADKNAKIEIFSTDGVLIQEGQSDENGQLMLELFNLDKGVYLIQSNNKTQKLMVK